MPHKFVFGHSSIFVYLVYIIYITKTLLKSFLKNVSFVRGQVIYPSFVRRSMARFPYTLPFGNITGGLFSFISSPDAEQTSRDFYKWFFTIQHMRCRAYSYRWYVKPQPVCNASMVNVQQLDSTMWNKLDTHRIVGSDKNTGAFSAHSVRPLALSQKSTSLQVDEVEECRCGTYGTVPPIYPDYTYR